MTCPTLVGGSTRPAPSSYCLGVSSALAAKLAAYSSDGAIVVGPRRFACSGIVGGDGSQVVALSPPGEGPVHFPTSAPEPRPYGEVASFIPACEGCMADIACGFFPKAARPTISTCTATRHPGEKVVRNSSTAVSYTDPPRVHGTSDYSGGMAAVYGTSVYVDPPR